MVVIVGTLLVIAIASATGAATGAAVSNATECYSPLKVVGLDNCPQLKSDEGMGSNSIVDKMINAKADMLRQVRKRRGRQRRGSKMRVRGGVDLIPSVVARRLRSGATSQNCHRFLQRQHPSPLFLQPRRFHGCILWQLRACRFSFGREYCVLMLFLISVNRRTSTGPSSLAHL